MTPVPERPSLPRRQALEYPAELPLPTAAQTRSAIGAERWLAVSQPQAPVSRNCNPVVARKLTRSLIAPRGTATALTPRERQILVLVAQGKSNRDIAGTLVISERTARTHVGHVLTKLGLASRTQAALWAVREGLVPDT